MSIENIALVRATNIIPFDGVVKPLSNVCHLTKNIGLPFSGMLSDFLLETGIIPKLDYSKMFDENYYDSYVASSSEILKDYLPYVSDYNSMVLFSLNGLCPDDNEHGFGNNTFSTKKCAIIEPLKYHINEAISLVPTDTAIKGDIFLSEEAILLIEKEYYETLGEEEIKKLNQLDMTLNLFTGSLKDAIKLTLINTNKYNFETLSLSESTGGVMPSKTSEEFKRTIKDTIQTYQLPDKKYYNLITSVDKTIINYDKVCDEYKNMLTVQNYFMTLFLQELLVKMGTSQPMIDEVPNNLYNKIYLSKVVECIKEYGIDNYKSFVDNYNLVLKEKQEKKELMTPQEIIATNSYRLK